jgi:hypothetical protein
VQQQGHSTIPVLYDRLVVVVVVVVVVCHDAIS